MTRREGSRIDPKGREAAVGSHGSERKVSEYAIDKSAVWSEGGG